MPAWSCGQQFRVVEGPGRGRTIPLDSPNLNIGRSRNPGDRAHGWIFLNDDSVSRLHAEVRWQEDSLSFELRHRSETNPTLVNGAEVQEKVLETGDRIKLGNTVLEFQQADTRFAAPEPTPAGAVPAKPVRFEVPDIVAPMTPVRKASLSHRPGYHLKVLVGPDAGLTHELSGLTITLSGPAPAGAAQTGMGPLQEQDIHLSDTSLSGACVGMSWRELDGGYSLFKARGSSVAVTVVRTLDGADWSARLEETPILVRNGDRIRLGESELHLLRT